MMKITAGGQNSLLQISNFFYFVTARMEMGFPAKQDVKGATRNYYANILA